jgi:ribonuclease HII
VIVGIDEAGRGPVLGIQSHNHLNGIQYIYPVGSLVYCAAFWPLEENEAISKLGFDDSKVLKEGERERYVDKRKWTGLALSFARLLQRIRDHPSIGWVIEEITAQDISEVDK